MEIHKYKYKILIFGLISILLILFVLSNDRSSQTISSKSNIDGLKEIESINNKAVSWVGRNSDSVLFFSQKAIQLSKQLEDNTGIALCNLTLSKINFKKQNYQTALSLSFSAAQLLESENQPSYLAATYNEIGRNYEALGDVNNAYKYFLLSNTSFHQTNTASVNRILNLNDLANISIGKGNYKNSFKFLSEAQKLSSKGKFDNQLADTYVVLSYLYFEQDEFENALNFAKMAKVIYVKLNKKYGVSSCQINIGNILFAMKHYDKALEILQPSFIKSLVEKDYFRASGAGLIISEIYIELNNGVKAKECVKKLKKASKNISHQQLSLEIELIEAKYALFANNIDTAIHILKDCIISAEKNDFLTIKLKALEGLSDVYNKKKDFYNALKYFKKYADLSKLLTNKDNVSLINLLQVTSDLESSQLESEQKSREIIMQHQRQKLTNRNSIFYLIGLMVSVILSIIIFAKQKQINQIRKKTLALEKDRLDDMVEIRNKQITDFAIHIEEKNSILIQIKNSLQNIRILKEHTIPEINDIYFLINDNISTNKEKVHLYSKIEENQSGFIDIIEKKYTSLTATEKKIVLLLRLNLSSKQISSQLNIALTSVESYRSRIRSKMNVPKMHKLNEFINKL